MRGVIHDLNERHDAGMIHHVTVTMELSILAKSSGKLQDAFI
jgi:hypothetical protein